MTDAVVVEGLALRRGGVEILRDVAFAVGPGLVALVGPNGAGKSSLLRVLSGVADPHAGSVSIAGHDLRREPVAARRALGYLPQSDELFPYLTAAELLQTFADVRGLADPEIERFAALTRPGACDLRIGILSVGQRRKLAFVLATQGAPPVWLFDEPFNALDDAARVHVRDAVVEHCVGGGTVILATHRLDDLSVAPDATLRVAEARVLDARS
jgi:ABC-type multidrug transport system ATPase subunit